MNRDLSGGIGLPLSQVEGFSRFLLCILCVSAVIFLCLTHHVLRITEMYQWASPFLFSGYPVFSFSLLCILCASAVGL